MTTITSDVVQSAYLSRRRRALRGLLGDKLSLVVVVSTIALVVIALAAPVLAPHPPNAVLSPPLQGPSPGHWLGTDEIGRDVLSRIVFGSRISLFVGVLATAVALIVGLPMGLVSGFFGRAWDTVMMRLTDGLLAFPPIILAMATVAVLGPSLTNTMIAIGIVQIPRFSRLVRAMTLSLKEQEYVSAATGLGASKAYILRRVIAPNLLSIVTVQFTLTFATAVLTEAALAFLGLGAQPPTASWGSMLDSGRRVLDANPWYALSAGTAIFLTVLVLTLLGDALRDVLDPFRVG